MQSEDEEIALVEPTEDTGAKNSSSSNMLLYPLMKLKMKLYAETCQCILSVTVLTLVVGGCFVSYVYCKPCLIGIIIASACMCPWIPYFNIPLWIGILLLVYVWYYMKMGFHISWDESM
jgi:hypothetical protein